MAKYLGYGGLKAKLARKYTRVNLRYQYYESKETLGYLSNSISLEVQRNYSSVIGWCAKAVDSLADRLIFKGFENDGGFELDKIFNVNNSDILFDSAILSALISSCSFIYISPDNDGYPRLKVIDGSKATGVIDPITGLLEEGYAIVDYDENDRVLIDAYFRPGYVEYHYFESNQESNVEVYNYSYVPYCLLVPIINRPDARRPFGHSRISRACMDLQESARRTLLRSEIAAEFYSHPQKYILGLEQKYIQEDSFNLAMTSMLKFTKDRSGDVPTVGQFSQASMTPYSDQLKSIASVFAGETGLTLDDLGFSTDNPSSAEAIRAGHESLRLEARKAQRTFGSGFLNVGYIACCLKEKFSFKREQLYSATPVWQPIFEPDAAMLSSIGDGAIKINQAVPNYFNKNTLSKLTGIEGGEDSEPTKYSDGTVPEVDNFI